LQRTFAADAGFAGVGRHDRDRNEKPIEVIMAPRSGAGLQSANGRYWARTSDPQLVELVLSQLS
jgi:hypothetical protein